jgi:hypothetical protein
MIDSIPRPDASLPEFLAARARLASDGRLVADAIAGAGGAVGVAYWGGPGWYLLLGVAVCFFAFGLWGIADRELGERSGAGSRAVLAMLLMLRVVAAAVGFLAAAFLMMSVLGKSLGRIIS